MFHENIILNIYEAKVFYLIILGWTEENMGEEEENKRLQQYEKES